MKKCCIRMGKNSVFSIQNANKYSKYKGELAKSFSISF